MPKTRKNKYLGGDDSISFISSEHLNENDGFVITYSSDNSYFGAIIKDITCRIKHTFNPESKGAICSQIYDIKENIRKNIDESEAVKTFPDIKEILYSIFRLDTISFIRKPALVYTEEKFSKDKADIQRREGTTLSNVCYTDEKIFEKQLEDMEYLRHIYDKSGKDEVISWGFKTTARYITVKIPFKYFSINPLEIIRKLRRVYDSSYKNYTREKMYKLKVFVDKIFEGSIEKIEDIVNIDEWGACMRPTSSAGGKRIKRKKIKSRKNKGPKTK
jgi:hypothetical protein